MKTALIVGATGLVGSELIKLLIENDNYKKIIVLTRRKLGFDHPKLDQRLVSFDKIDEIAINDVVDYCFCTLGTTQAKSGKKGLELVDFEYVVKLAKLCKHISTEKMLIVSSTGANPESMFFYLRTKGKMEEAVKNLCLPAVYFLRPSLITGKREKLRLAEAIGGLIYKISTPFLVGKRKKLRPVSATQIAKTLVGLAQSTLTGNIVFESDFIKEY